MSAPAWLADARAKAWDAFAETPLPGRVAHLWRYTDPAVFARPQASPSSNGSLAGAIVTVASPGGIPEGVDVIPLARAATEVDRLADRLGSLVGARAGKFEALNLAGWQDGMLVRVPRGAAPDRPVLLSVRTGERELTLTRLVVVVEEGASLTLVDDYVGGGATAEVNAVVEAFVGPGAFLRHVTVQELGPHVRLHLTQRARLDRDARSEMVLVSAGGGVVKADVGALLEGPGARSEAYGVVVGTDRRHLDHHTVHEHRAPRTFSRFDYKSILLDRSRSVYTGTIRINAGATGCEAYQENRNLMLSDAAKADSIPELEILNDEVKCSHGATMGPIEPEYLFYLMSRGIPEPQAVHMLVEGFVDSAFRHAPDDLRPRLIGILDRALDVE